MQRPRGSANPTGAHTAQVIGIDLDADHRAAAAHHHSRADAA